MKRQTFTIYTGEPKNDEEYQVFITNEQQHRLSFDTTPEGNVKVTADQLGNFTEIVIPECALRWAFELLEGTLDSSQPNTHRGFHRVRD